MNVMFLDESGDHSLEKIDASYPMFVLAGCIFDFDYYLQEAEKKVNELKLKFFGKTNIILRSYDIRKQKGDFSCLVARRKREEFYEAIDKLVEGLNFTVIATAINKTKLKGQYGHPTNPYHLCLQFILERAVMYLGRSNGKMMFRIESRETHNDQKLSEVYELFRNTNHRLFNTEEIQSKLTDLSFNQKIQNIAGMQIADLVAYPIGKWVLDNSKENKAFTIIQKKLHKKPRTETFLNYGLKVFP
jgi:hypothetical protein